MRVRHLQTHLEASDLIGTDGLEALANLRIGVDVVYWLRSIQALKDPFAEALGSIPPGIFGFVDIELMCFARHGITPVFVFQGIAPEPPPAMVTKVERKTDQAWSHLRQGQLTEAQKIFALSISRINSDFVHFIFHHLRQKGCEVLQAPYSSAAQLAHFEQHGFVDMLFGPPGLLMYGAQQVIVRIGFAGGEFGFVNLEAVMSKWNVTRDQFVDACLLAGTEYCLAFPYDPATLDAPDGNGPETASSLASRCAFEAAVKMIKQAPLISWMEHFPSAAMRDDHVECYAFSRVLVYSCPVLHIQTAEVRPLDDESLPGVGDNGRGGQRAQGARVPCDYSSVIGRPLPDKLHFLAARGVISRDLLHALAKGEWLDMVPPLVDTAEYRGLIQDMGEYRQRALGLVARHLQPSFMEQNIACTAFWDHGTPSEPRVLRPAAESTLCWRIRRERVEQEMLRQGVRKVDIRFCLRWHANEVHTDGPLMRELTRTGRNELSHDLSSLCALVHLMLLELLELVFDDGGMTHLGNVLKDVPVALQEPILTALEMMKFGLLTAEPFDPPQPNRPFSEQWQYPEMPATLQSRSRFLLARAMSLVPMRLNKNMWNASVDFDLAAFHCLVRVLKRTLRQLTEATLTSVLLNDFECVDLLPPSFMCPSPLESDPWHTSAIFPTFMFPRACMGIVVLFLLDYQGSPAEFEMALVEAFPCCKSPLADLKLAILFWEELERCVNEIVDPLGAEELAMDVQAATSMLLKQQDRLSLFPDQRDREAANAAHPKLPEQQGPQSQA